VFSWPCLIYICDNYEAHCSNQNLVFKVSFLIKDRVDSEHLKDIGNVCFFLLLLIDNSFLIFMPSHIIFLVVVFTTFYLFHISLWIERAVLNF